MKNKIIGAIIIIMLSMPALSAFGANNTNIKEAEIEKTNVEEQLSLSINPAPLFIGVNLKFENTGGTTLNDIEWSFRTKAVITGTGIFIREKLQEGIIDEIGPGETKTIQFRLLSTQTKSPLGLGNIYMNASAETDGVSVRTQQRALIILFFLIMYRDTYMDIKPAEAYQRYLNEEFDLIIDVVGLDIYNLGHLPGAVNYVWADGTLNSKLPELDPTWTYLVYCHTDPPSTASAQAMINYGIPNVYRLEGNFAAWKNAGYPIET
jgi:rhodanese-related sulfurtransferase